MNKTILLSILCFFGSLSLGLTQGAGDALTATASGCSTSSIPSFVREYEASGNKFNFLSSVLSTGRLKDVVIMYRFCKPEDKENFLATVKLWGKGSDFVRLLPSEQVSPALNILQGVDKSGLRGYDLSGMDLDGFDPGGKDLYNVNFSGSTITLDQLAKASYIGYCNLFGTGVTKDAILGLAARQSVGKETVDLDTIVFSQN